MGSLESMGGAIGRAGRMRVQGRSLQTSGAARGPPSLAHRLVARGRGAMGPAVPACVLDPAVLADGGAALLALRLLAAVFADGGAAALLAFPFSAAVFADGGAAALLAMRLSAAAVFAALLEF